jgi:hypothetical protein
LAAKYRSPRENVEYNNSSPRGSPATIRLTIVSQASDVLSGLARVDTSEILLRTKKFSTFQAA